MKKTIAILAATLMLTGCGQFDREVAKLFGYTLVCVKETGVTYVQFPSGVAPLIDKEGKPVPCK